MLLCLFLLRLVDDCCLMSVGLVVALSMLVVFVFGNGIALVVVIVCCVVCVVVVVVVVVFVVVVVVVV